jgi:alkanesulfonate monooxygenase
VDEACHRIGRDPSTLIRSVAQVLCCGRDEAEIARRAERIGRQVQEIRDHGLAGTPGELVERIGQFNEIGVTRVYLQLLDLADLDHLQLVADEVMGKLPR